VCALLVLVVVMALSISLALRVGSNGKVRQAKASQLVSSNFVYQV